ncbi:MAG TPA: c-type cytochrome biogenesis protein CcsB [Actinomycetes bacterium]|nr:c-type cytochrome biogenesis protein CcsB [Actinomycetes bacterium]
MSSAGLAGLSNNLLYSAMVVYALAMYCYTASLAFSRPGRVPAEERVEDTTQGLVQEPTEVRELAAVGGSGSTTTYDVEHTAGGATATPDLPERADRLSRVGVSLTVLAFALHLGAVVTRGLSADRAPWGNMFEFSVTGALAVTGVYLVLLRRHDIRYLGTFVVLPVLLTLGLAVTVLYTESAQLVPALKSVWLVIHVSAAIIASGILTVGFAQTVCFLVQDRREQRPVEARTPSFMDRLPSAAALDRSAYRMHAFAYPIWTFAVIAGAIWAENAWGRYWGWDPKETWAFITWMVYTAYLHARATAGWKGRKASYVALLGYATFLFNYLVVNIWLVGFHSYAGVG